MLQLAAIVVARKSATSRGYSCRQATHLVGVEQNASGAWIVHQLAAVDDPFDWRELTDADGVPFLGTAERSMYLLYLIADGPAPDANFILSVRQIIY